MMSYSSYKLVCSLLHICQLCFPEEGLKHLWALVIVYVCFPQHLVLDTHLDAQTLQIKSLYHQSQNHQAVFYVYTQPPLVDCC